MSSAREHDGWLLAESGSPEAEHTVLLIPGGLSTSVFYDELVAEPLMNDPAISLVATTLPGHGGTPPPADVGMENYARLMGKLAADLGCDVVVAHSMGANVAIEMACTGEFSGPLVLLSPSFSRDDESAFLRAMDRLAGVFGHLPFSLMLALAGPAMKSSTHVPPDRYKSLVAELHKNDPRFVRRAIRSYFEYLEGQVSLPQRLIKSGVPVWVVFGERDDVGFKDEERAVLERSRQVNLVTVADAGHLSLAEKPERIAEVVRDALTTLTST